MTFNLSEKIKQVRTYNWKNKEKEWKVIQENIVIEDVKEFIRLLKSKRNNGDFVHIRDIDKLAGEKLV